jgi:hypothetical protein
MEFSVNMLSSGSQKLRDIERAAKQARTAIWTNYVPQASNQSKLSDTFIGKVRGASRRAAFGVACVQRAGAKGQRARWSSERSQ